MMFRKSKQPDTTISLLRDIKSAVVVTMLLSAITAGSTCDIGSVAEFSIKLIEEPDEAEADRAVAGGAGIEV